MKKTITLLLTLCLLLGLLPTEAVAYLGDIQTVDSGTVTAKKLNSGSWELRNDYLRVIVRKDGTLSTAPAADSADPTDRQTPFCNFVTFKGRGDNKRDIVVARQFFCETRTEFLRKNSPVLRSKSETRSLASTAPKMEGAAHVKGRVLAWGGAAFAAPPLAFCPWGSSYPSVASPASSAASWAATGSVYSDQP